ncbi:MAG: PEP-CTERM sorting domain-containing protein [Chthoniobacterales bacterium]|nr:PEP-CTERM sorting domain-containing protein [Chthoniobacterales bacterium]
MNTKTALVALALLALGGQMATHAATWTGGNTTSNWGDSTKWNPNTAPNGIGETATFDNSSFFGAGGTILLGTSSGVDTNITIGTWTKSSASLGRLVTINNVASGTGKLIFDVASGNATYYSSNGNSASGDTLNVGIQLNDSLAVTVGGAASVNFAGVVSESGGSRSITKIGATTLIMSGGGANTFSGGVTINDGTVSAQKTGALGTGNVLVMETTGTTTATLSITTGVTNAIADTAFLSLESSGANFATVNLASGINETVGGLFFNGVAQADGTWGATGSGATNINDSWFTGAGIITVVPEPSTALLIAAGTIGMIFRRRFRA